MKRLPTGFSVALGLTFILPLLNYFRAPPINDFFSEWSSALALASAAVFATPFAPRSLKIPWSLWLAPAALIALILVHGALGKYDYPSVWVPWIGYLGLLFVAVLIGQCARNAGLQGEVVENLCWILVITAGLNFLFQLAQVTKFDESLRPYVFKLVERSICRVYGNVAQANHAAALACLALAGVYHLAAVKRLRAPLAIALGAALLVSISLTASRMSWAFLAVVMVAVLCVPGWRGRSTRFGLAAAGMLPLGYLVADLAASRYLLPMLGSECVSATARMAGEVQTLSVRWELWRQALMVWKTSPWIGVGAGKFMGRVYDLQPLGQPQPLDFYAHNTALQLLAEFGLIGAGIVGLVVLIWIVQLVKRRSEMGATEAIMLVWLGIIGAHSLLEYPLWSVYFLALFGLLIGLIIALPEGRPALTLPGRGAAIGLATAAIAGCVLAVADYTRVDHVMFIATVLVDEPSARSDENLKRLAAAADGVWLYRFHAEHATQLMTPVDKKDIEAKIARTDRLLRNVPIVQVIYRRIMLAVLAGDLEGARLHLKRLLMFYPGRDADTIAQMRRLIELLPQDLGALTPILDAELARAPESRW